jgi:hypothetical protein
MNDGFEYIAPVFWMQSKPSSLYHLLPTGFLLGLPFHSEYEGYMFYVMPDFFSGTQYCNQEVMLDLT